jgi:TonB-linked SusC/RagA family outer membrane protein
MNVKLQTPKIMKKKLTEYKYSSLSYFPKFLLIMKFCLFLSLAFTIQTFASDVLSQRTNKTIADKATSLAEIFNEIEDQTSYRFLYHSDAIKDIKIALNTKNKTWIDVLDQISNASNLDYEIFEDDLIVFRPAVMQEPTKITGQVNDAETGEPLIGVTVMVKGTTMGTITNMNGEYELEIPESAKVLVYQFVGMIKQEIPIEDQKSISVTMEPDLLGIEEVVVVGYGMQKRASVTGSLATVNSEQIVRVPVPNAVMALSGTTPGLYLKQTSGVPGNENINLSIRGFGNPLVLVDGIESGFNRLDPEEIESVTVFKDASAAVYGARAGNGVILVTTKRGVASSKPLLSYKGGVVMQTQSLRPHFVNSWEFAESLREGELNQDLPTTFSEEDIQKFKDGNDPNYPNTDWFDVTLKDWAPMYNQNVSLRGGTQKLKYFTSIGYLDQKGLYESNDLDYKRISARVNINAEISKHLEFVLTANFNRDLENSPQTSVGGMWGELAAVQPTWPAELPDPSLGASFAGKDIRAPLAQTRTDITGEQVTKFHELMTTAGIVFHVPKVTGLDVAFNFNYRLNNLYIKSQDRPFDILSYDYDTDTYSHYGVSGTSELNSSYRTYSMIYPELRTTYKNTFGKHNVGGLFVFESIDTDSENFNTTSLNLLSDNLPYHFVGSTENIENGGNRTKTGRVSYIGRVNYDYDSRYLFEATLRVDQSYKFPEESRTGYFPSVSLGWRLSEESIIKNNASWINNLKLRLSYGQTGNDAVTAFQYLTGYNILSGGNNNYLFGNDVYRLLRTTGMPNMNITWHEMNIYNAGIDAKFLNGLFGFEFDMFYRLQSNIFGEPLESYPSIFGADLPLLNINSNDDRGFELILHHDNRINSKISYNVAANFSLAREKYKEYSEPVYNDPDEIRINKREGNYTNRTIGYVSDGIFMSQDEIDNYPVDQDQAGNSTLLPGDIKYVDLNGDNVLDWRDQKEIGLGTFPDAFFGLNLQAQYGNFSFGALFQGASMYNREIGSATRERNALMNYANIYRFQYDYRWTPDPNNPGVNINPDAQLPGFRGDGSVSPNNDKISDFWLLDASYFRLKNVSLSYTLPQEISQKASFEAISIALSGSNLFTMSKLGIYKNDLDPEANSNMQIYPTMKTVALEIRLTL